MAKWNGSSYQRGGAKLKTKWGTTFSRRKSFRNANTGWVHSTPRYGKFLGVEKTGEHPYGFNPKKNDKEKRRYIKIYKRYKKGKKSGGQHYKRRIK